jgi:hypothetical protein
MPSLLAKAAATTAIVAVGMLATLIPAARAAVMLQPGSFAVTATSNQAGAHPDLTASFAFVTDSRGRLVGDHPKTIAVDLPSGFSGEPPATPRCPLDQFSSEKGGFSPQTCPPDTQVGTAVATVNDGTGAKEERAPVYNLVPNEGETAKFGFFTSVFGIQAVVSVRPGDYGVHTTVQNLDESAGELDASSLTLWGVPADPSHDAQRGLVCNGASCAFCNGSGCGGGPISAGTSRVPFLRNPTECTSAPLTATLGITSWEHPEQPPETFTANVGPITGCDRLGFDPTISVQPTVTQPGVPAGYTVDLKVPQNSNPDGLSSADLRRAIVTFPAGVALSPSAANGLQACTDAQVGLGTSEPPSCPDGSKLGEATVTTPALPDKLAGALYLAGPAVGPITGPPYRTFLTLAGDGVTVKLVGSTSPDPSTGQLVTTFEENPQLPFSELMLRLNEGPRAPLANPDGCGTFVTRTDLTPWSSPFTPDATPFSPFEITGCGAPRFAPSFNAGSVSNQAGGFSPFTVTVARGDSDQHLSGISVQTPPGLLGMLSNVTLCPEPQASAGACGPASLIGHATTAAGPGADPFWVGGNVFITGPYKGAPFGLSIVVHAVAGPFDLGNVVVRAAIHVDPHTSQLTVTSDPLPRILGGIPLDLRTVNVTIDRPSFTFNPTSCNIMSVGGRLTSVEGASAVVSSRFQAANCAALPFKPKFTALTLAKTSKASGAYLHVKIVSGAGQANIAKVKVDLPLQLPSQLKTLQKACLASVFESNPAGCPPESIVGQAKVVTPLLPVPLTGPAYFVSYGNEEFPSLTMVLQGYGVTVDLIGSTFISKAGITSTTFKTVPDVPFNTFELILPQGRYAALAVHLPDKAKGSLCGRHLEMPTLLVAQNGAEIHQNTPIAVAGCKKAKKSKKARRGSKATHYGKHR